MAEQQMKNERPWGYYIELHQNEDCKVKKIVVYPKQRISLQSHKKRRETWLITKGQGIVELGYGSPVTERQDVYTRQVSHESLVLILEDQKHRITNISENENLEFVEIQTGVSFAEEDITRYEDDYGRTEK